MVADFTIDVFQLGFHFRTVKRETLECNIVRKVAPNGE